MKILIEESYEALSKKCAEIIAEQLKTKPKSVLGLATGSTPVGTYKELIRMYKAGEIDFSEATAFNLDEYFPIKKENSRSYTYFMAKNLFEHVNFAKTFIQNGETENIAEECLAYEEKIALCGGIDLQILGIGYNGHIGFNEPSDFFSATTHFVALDETTIKANARFFENEDDVPRHALTMGIKTIMSAKRIILLASGAGKADIIDKALNYEITPKNPSSVLQLHPNVTVITDKEAGRLLEKI